MRRASLNDLRELLSSAAATQFFESWAQTRTARLQAEELLESVATQLASAEARVRLAEEEARTFTIRAEAERRRPMEAGLAQDARQIVRLEAEALSHSFVGRAERALAAAAERRRRAVALQSQAAEAARALEDVRVAQERLRDEAWSLGAFVGETCLFFADADEAGGFFVVPLSPLATPKGALEAFILHRLAPGVSLAEAQAVRDAAGPKPRTEMP